MRSVLLVATPLRAAAGADHTERIQEILGKVIMYVYVCVYTCRYRCRYTCSVYIYICTYMYAHTIHTPER